MIMGESFRKENRKNTEKYTTWCYIINPSSRPKFEKH